MIHAIPRQRPTVAQVHEILRRHCGLIVHFSGAPKGVGVDRGLLYPADLRHVVAGRAMGGISCSVVKPTDVFGGMERNATGCIGVIVDLTTPESVVGAVIGDAGSNELEDGQRIVDKDVDLSADDLEATITQRPIGVYNEWVIRNFKVLGILAVPPFDITVMDTLEEPPDMPDWLRSTQPHPVGGTTDIEGVLRDFPELPVVTFQGGRMAAVRGEANFYAP